MSLCTPFKPKINRQIHNNLLAMALRMMKNFLYLSWNCDCLATNHVAKHKWESSAYIEGTHKIIEAIQPILKVLFGVLVEYSTQ
jgi:hypothetical protein